MIELPPEIEQQLADLTDAEFSALTARLRAPDNAEQLRELAKTIVPAHAIDAYMSVVDVSKFVGADGTLDEARLRSTLGVLFGTGQQQSYDWGQHGGQPPGWQFGDGGRAEAQRRAAERNGQAGTPAGAEALRGLSSQVENGGTAEARRRAAQQGYAAGGREGPARGAGAFGAGGRAEAARRRDARGGQN
jgi:hypothetical protein